MSPLIKFESLKYQLVARFVQSRKKKIKNLTSNHPHCTGHALDYSYTDLLLSIYIYIVLWRFCCQYIGLHTDLLRPGGSVRQKTADEMNCHLRFNFRQCLQYGCPDMDRVTCGQKQANMFRQQTTNTHTNSHVRNWNCLCPLVFGCWFLLISAHTPYGWNNKIKAKPSLRYLCDINDNK